MLSSALDTKQLYWDPQSGWLPSRRRLHEELVEQSFQGKQPHDDRSSRPLVRLFVGLPGSGKNLLAEQDAENSVVLDPDYFLVRLPEFQEAFERRSRDGAQLCYAEAAAINNLAWERAVSGRFNVVFLATGGGFQWLYDKMLSRAYSEGYFSHVVMIHVPDVNLLVRRVEARGARNGRFVSEERIRELARVLPGNFCRLIDHPSVQTARLLDSERQIVMSAHRTLGRLVQTVWDFPAWAEFNGITRENE